MLPRLLPLTALIVGLLALPASAAESASPPASATGEPAPAKPASDALQTGSIVQPGEMDFSREFADRLVVGGGNLAAADREDRAALAAFYAGRQQQPVWVAAGGLTAAAEAVAAEIRRAGDWGLEASAFRLPALTAPAGAQLSRAERADAEIALSLAILKYARHARGSRSDPATLSKYLDRKLSLLAPPQVIDDAAKAQAPDAYLRSLHPQHPPFEALRQKYLALRGGQAADKANARKVLVNMEEWRWMPATLGEFYVWVNVPEFTLRVVKNGQIIHTERVVVGKADTQTPIFSQDMEQVVFHPSWGVPESIKKQDVLPSLARGSTRIFTFYHLRIQRGGRDIDPATVDWTTADMRQFHVYQPPGENNVLGNIKFRFPNKHDVYMHDTPQKNLFNADVRAFSHGCMRVRNPQKLAELLLAEDQDWPAARVAAAVAAGAAQNNAVNIGRKFPVHVTYFTAAVQQDGTLKLFSDVYGHEGKIALGMEGKAHLIPKDKSPVRAEAIGNLAQSTSGGFAKKDLVRSVFGNN
jgi:L,D-transpeptidase YcbB